MHEWGDEWFENYGDDLYKAIDFIEQYLRKHHIGIYGKEKYGTYRDEYLRFWEGGLYQILFGNRYYVGTLKTFKIEETKVLYREKHEYQDHGGMRTEYLPVYDEHHWRHKFNIKIAPKLVDIATKFHIFIAYRVDENVPPIPFKTPIEEYEKYYKKRIWPGLKTINWKIGLTRFVQSIQAKYYNYAFQLACQKWPHVQEELICDVDGYKMIKPCKYGNVDGTAIHNKYWREVK